MADKAEEQVIKKRTSKKFTYRGVDLDQLLDMPNEQLMELMHCRARRRFTRGLNRKPMALVKKLRKAKKEAPPLERSRSLYFPNQSPPAFLLLENFRTPSLLIKLSGICFPAATTSSV
ncbi:unnamed protein product [Callosobruchus maculatus]|uniref:40S ribosomal protein S15 n=1 Tax=Callosobruchus maculatus TaxID=64391 RepID=A0A653DHK4_CALMS|nr:unnamed protein product [Callosobruchus maculatus]